MTLCSFGIHDYNKWEDKETGTITQADTKSSRPAIVQVRKCNKCGKKTNGICVPTKLKRITNE